MIHIIADSAAELGFISGMMEKSTVCIKPMFRNKFGKLQESYELNKESKDIINTGVDAIGLGNEFKV